MNNIFDTHAHYNDEQFDSDRVRLFSSLNESGVTHVINCGTDLAASLVSLGYAHEYDFIYAACGIHPEDIKDGWEKELDGIEKLLTDEKCVAVGEIGLDYHWDIAPRDVQKEVFIKQILLAEEYDLPVIVHDREAHGDTMEILKKYKPEGVLHCFSGSVESAEELVKIGMYIGFGGVVTFKNAVKSLEVAAAVPEDRILLETDCPYMAPVPFRGKRNDSMLISYVAEKIAEIRGCSAQHIADISQENAKRLFNIK